MRDSPLQAGDRQRYAGARLRWLETLLLTAAVPAVRVALGSGDPFLCRGVFAWLSFVPLAIAVQHGFACAIASATLLCAGAGAHAVVSGGLVPSPALGAACCAIVALTGRACDARRERCERLRRHVVQLETALGRERASRQVLQLSHERLAQQLAGAPHSAQASVEAAVQRLPELQNVAELGKLLLDVLAQQAELQVGAVFVADGEGRLLEPAVATLGPAGALASGLLVTRAFRTRRLTSVVDDGRGSGVGAAGLLRGADAGRDNGLAALPLMAADATLRGVVSIEHMPFAAFHPAALRQAFVIASRVVGAIEPEVWAGWIEKVGRPGPEMTSGKRSSAERSCRSFMGLFYP